MNDNQYIAHSSEIICHSGKKGMKWGQGPYSKLKGYVKKIDDDASKFVDEKITGKSAQAEADRYNREADFWSTQIGKKQGHVKDYTKMAEVYDKQASAKNAKAARGVANEFRRIAMAYGQYMNESKAKAHSAQKRADKSLFGKARKSYRIIKTKAGQIFGKPKLG